MLQSYHARRLVKRKLAIKVETPFFFEEKKNTPYLVKKERYQTMVFEP